MIINLHLNDNPGSRLQQADGLLPALDPHAGGHPRDLGYADSEVSGFQLRRDCVA